MNFSEEKTPGEIYRVLFEASKSFDGQVWAKHYLEFARQFPMPVIDEEVLTAWFCNAIMAGYDAGQMKQQENKKVDSLAQQLTAEDVFQPLDRWTKKDLKEYILAMQNVLLNELRKNGRVPSLHREAIEVATELYARMYGERPL